MSAQLPVQPVSEKQSDLLLWLAATAVAALGATWLLISQPWSSGASAVVVASPRPAPATVAADPPSAPGAAPTAALRPRSGLDDPLRMAQLAYEAGMLTEPADYSAWTLFARVLEQEPGNAAAEQGLSRVAADLLRRGDAALEQGRYDDARATVERILGALPEHAGAAALAARIDAAVPRPAPAPAPPVRAALPTAPEPRTARAAPAAPAIVPARAPVREQPKVDPIVAAHEGFERAMRENRLLAPAGDSARHHVAAMIAAAPDHELALRDRDLLVTELLARSTQALEALDTDAAATWIDAAERLAVEPTRVAAARDALTDRLIAMESAKPLPASALTVLEYVAPQYPRIGMTRGLEGWVDLEFTVAEDGTTKDVTVADASHDRVFRDEAVGAVQQWRFEPRVFMDRPIAQRAYTRVRFVLAE